MNYLDLLNMKVSSILKANTNVEILELLAKNDSAKVEQILELDLDSQIMSIVRTDFPLYSPWYQPYGSKDTKDEQIKRWGHAISRIAVYRQNHSAEMRLLEAGSNYHEKLMTYLPKDYINVAGLDSLQSDVDIEN